MTVALIDHEDCVLHDAGPGHPERPDRIRAVNLALDKSGLREVLTHIKAPLATREQLVRVHAERYVDAVFEHAPEQGVVHLDPDTAMNPHSLDAARRAAGSVVEGTDRVLAGDVRAAYCNVRPCGHHAERARAMGFCLFNNVAVGAAHALAVHGLERVAIVDFDVHHGNGTEDIFADDPRVLFCSTFQHPFYPGSGANTQSEHIVNLPLSAGTDGTLFRQQVSERILPALEDFQPQLLYISAGFDAHRSDPLAQLELVEEDYAWVTRELKAFADRHIDGRIVSVLEGGYDLTALGNSVVAHLQALTA